VNVDGVNYNVVVAPAGTVALAPAAGGVSAPSSGSVAIPAPVAGTVIRYAAAEGAQVKAGDTVIILESMKMELEIKATDGGKIHFLVAPGAQVAAQQPVAELGGVAGAVSAAPPAAAPSAAPAPAAAAVSGTAILAPVAGTIIRYAVPEGAQAAPGDTIIIIESMKMELESKATADGQVHYHAAAGTQVASQEAIAQIG
jgi:oxaloacetate decarboxylase alpha subunit